MNENSIHTHTHTHTHIHRNSAKVKRSISNWWG